jgi:Berberine and berberine like
MRHQHACRVVAAALFAALCGAIECQPAALVAVRETGLTWANMLRAFQVGKALTTCSSPRSYVAMFHLKGAVSRVAEGATAFGNRQAAHAITLDGVWRPGEDFGDRDTAWSRGFFAALGRFRKGVYVNFLGGDEDPDRVREAYGDSVYDRLVDIKTRYDPDNVFHHN